MQERAEERMRGEERTSGGEERRGEDEARTRRGEERRGRERRRRGGEERREDEESNWHPVLSREIALRASKQERDGDQECAIGARENSVALGARRA
ncbi:unnamed protein product [Lota lota]